MLVLDMGQFGAMALQQSGCPARRIPGRHANAGSAVQSMTTVKINNAPFLLSTKVSSSVSSLQASVVDASLAVIRITSVDEGSNAPQ